VEAESFNIMESRGVLVNAVATGIGQMEEGPIDVMTKTSIKFFSLEGTNLRKPLILSF
jgi:hypothetical protein